MAAVLQGNYSFSERIQSPEKSTSAKSDRCVSSFVYVKSDSSKEDALPNFREKTPSSTESSVSVKSDWSKEGNLPNFSEKTPKSTESVKSGSCVSSSVSVKSDWSKEGNLPNFSEKTPKSTESVKSGSCVSSSVSVKSDWSKEGNLPNFSEKTPSSTKRIEYETGYSHFQSARNQKNFAKNILLIFQDLEATIIQFLKDELEMLKKILQNINTCSFVKDFSENKFRISEAALDLTLHFLKEMKQDEAADALKYELLFIPQLKCSLTKKYQCVSEGIAKQGDSTLLNNIYTDLYITQGCSEQVNTEHEVRQIEVTSRRSESQEIPVKCKNLFHFPEQDKEIRSVLTKGVAGIGKSVSVQKFILDWAEGKENQDISFIFPLPFREMNLKEKEKQSLMDLITQFFPETKGLKLTRRNRFKVLFILDGLDEFRLPLDFDGNETCRDLSSPVSLDVLLTNLIKGNLLPSALVWITSRPAAASKIPPDCIDRLTEIRGFNDSQKEEYFRKRFTDQNQAKEIIDHVKQSKSLFIMCHIPVFCWISATVLNNILQEKRNNEVKNNQPDDASKTLQKSNTEETPKTLTQMYTHFLRFQIQQSRRKYDGENTPDVSWDKDFILSLGKLAFQQLENSNLIFYDTDLEACGIDVYKASVYSGMCTQIFREETGIIIGTMYCFIHLSIQEFIAALYAHLYRDISRKSVFVQDSTEQGHKNETLIDFLKKAVDKALESDTGHLDLFLRFLLGLSLQSNRRLLRGLLAQQDETQQYRKEIIQYIKQKFEGNISPERSINLLYCLNELNDQSLVKEIQTHLSKGSLSSADLSPAQWSALAFVLLTSEEELEEFELQKFKKSDECLIRLSAVIKASKRALLNDCDLTEKSCSALATVLGSDNSLKELNMSNNKFSDSGVKLLCTGLENIKCELEILSLSKCDLTEESCSALATVLGSDTSLKELNMSNNKLHDSGLKQLCTALRKKSQLEILRLRKCDLTEKSCLALASVLSSDSSSLKDLDLSNNDLKDSGVKLLSDGLRKKCKLEKIRLSKCSVTEEGYKALSSALRSNPSHLIELELTGNDPGQSGVKELSDLLQDPHCQLNTLRFLSPAADEACQFVTGVMHENPLLLREFILSRCNLGDRRVKQLSVLLEDKHCRLNRLQLNNNHITAEGCEALTKAFNSNPSHLIELDLSRNQLGNSGIKKICYLLKNTQCRLEKLKLCDCGVTEEGYKALSSALRSNPSHLIELELTGNDPGQSGVKELSDLLQDPHCQLNTLRFLSPAADEACQFVPGVVGKNPFLLRELDLSGRELGDTGVNQLSALLQDKHCRLNTIQLNNNRITAKGCEALTKAFNLNPSHLIELDLSANQLGNSGIKNICYLLKNTQCRLKKLKLCDCGVTEEGYKALSSALRSNPSHLIELELTGNDPGQSGVKELSDLLQDPHCQLNTLRFLSPAADRACQFVTGVVGKNPLLLRKLDLCGRELGETQVNQLSALLQDKHCQLNTIQLGWCKMTENGCSAVTSALKSNPSHLRNLNLSWNKLGDSGVKNLSDLLMNPQLKLEKLHLKSCSITEEQSFILTSALKSNPSHLRDLDLTFNKLGDSGVNHLCGILKNSRCQLQRLSLIRCGITDVSPLTQCLRNTKMLQFLKEINLSNNEIGDSKQQLIDLIRDSNCKTKVDLKRKSLR